MASSVIVMAPEELVQLVRIAVRDEVGALNPYIRPDESMPEEDAARFVGVATNTLRQWRVEKRGPAYHKVGRSVRYTRADLEAWQAANRVHTIDSLPEGRRA